MVWNVGLLGRGTQDLLVLLDNLEQQRGDFRSLRERNSTTDR